MRNVLKYCLSTLATLVLALSAGPRAEALVAAPIADSVRVSLVTFYPGSEIYELYGHSEIRVTNPKYGDIYFNYGVFDFNAPNFLMRFMLGETDYWCQAVPSWLALRGHEGRKMVEQELNLTQEQARELSELLATNAKYGNNTYRYKYFSDNCATRPRDMIERVTGGSLITYDGAEDKDLEPLTFRGAIHRAAANYPWVRFGVDLVLGSSCDTTISWRQAMFSPMVLRHAAAQTLVNGPDGTKKQLVRREAVLTDGDDQGTVLPPTPWYLSPMTAALVLLAVTLLITWRDLKKKRLSRWFDSLLLLTGGIAGCLIAFLVIFSSHEAVAPNYNLLWLHPLLLLMAVLAWGNPPARLYRWMHLANVLLLLAMAAVWSIGIQSANAAFIPLATVLAMRSLVNWHLLGKSKK